MLDSARRLGLTRTARDHTRIRNTQLASLTVIRSEQHRGTASHGVSPTIILPPIINVDTGPRGTD